MHRFFPSLLLTLPVSLVLGCSEEDKEPGTPPGDGDDTGVETDTDTDTDVVITDADHDGFTSDVDCDDNDYTVFPGADELCDGVDNDCDSEIDEDFDADGDGAFDSEACATGTDCDDTSAEVCPDCEDIAYDGVDQDCSGADLTDVDGDGFDAEIVGGPDCDDGDPAISPEGEEVPKDGVDQDCDGEDLLDADGDGFDDVDFGGDDCDDTDAGVSPGAFDFMNDTVDADCDGRDGRALALIDAPVTVDGTANQQEYTGAGVALCDIDEDGLDDLIVSAPLLSASTSSYEGAVGIWYGSDAATWSAGMAMSTADTLIWGDGYDFLGLGLACADADGDGADDIIVSTGEYGPFGSEFSIAIFTGGSGVLGATLGVADAEAVLLYPLGATSADSASIYSNSFSVEDIDGDGAGELMLLQTERTWADGSVGSGDGGLWMIPGGERSGTITLTSDIDHSTIFEDQTGALSSWSVFDDLDGDGNSDLFIGQGGYQDDPEADEPVNVGRASTVSGWPSVDGPVHDTAAAELVGDGSEMAYGWQGAAGDFDGDGLSDLLVSAITLPYGGAENAGGLYLYSDAASHLTGLGLDGIGTADADVQGQWGEGYLGSRLWTVGDMDGDGADDVLVREPGAGTSATGRVRVVSGALIDGSALNVDDAQLIELRAEDSSSSTALESAIGDVDGDGVPDFAIAARTWGLATTGASTGRVYIYLSSTLGVVP